MNANLTGHLSPDQEDLSPSTRAMLSLRAQVMERLTDPAIYADAALVKKLVERHNELRDRTDTVGPELDGLRAELAEAEEPQLVRSE